MLQGHSQLHMRDWKYTCVIDAIYRTMMHKSNKKGTFELIVSPKYPFPFLDYDSYYTIRATSN